MTEPKRAWTHATAEEDGVELATTLARASIVMSAPRDGPRHVDLGGYRLIYAEASGFWNVHAPDGDLDDVGTTTTPTDVLNPRRFHSARQLLAYLEALADPSQAPETEPPRTPGVH